MNLHMEIKGRSMQTQQDFDIVYRQFVMQIQAHHNSDPFVVKAVGNFALQNLQYLISRAKLELDIYYL